MRFSIHQKSINGWKIFSLRDQATGSFADIIPEAGGILNAFGFNRQTGNFQIIDGYDSKQDWQEQHNSRFKSAKLSPFACRISNASFQWQAETYSLQKSVTGGHALHGLLFDADFRVADEYITEDFAELHLISSYRGTDPGYPFAYDLLVRYRLSKDRRLLLFTAIHNRSRLPIPVADGWHSYFSFGKPVDSLLLTIKARSVFEYNANLVPTGNFTDDKRWFNGASIGSMLLDNCYVLLQVEEQPGCVLTDQERGVSVEIIPSASYPFLQVYIPEHRNSIALEPVSAPPDVFNNGINLITLAPDHTATFSVDFMITLKNNR